jgi:hypothetical protein
MQFDRTKGLTLTCLDVYNTRSSVALVAELADAHG